MGENRMGYVKVASVKDVPSGSMKGVEARGKPILLANLSGKYHALGNVCTHLGCLLSDGTLEGETVTCSCHGSKFNVKTGKPVAGPATKPEPSYPVKIEGNHVMASV